MIEVYKCMIEFDYQLSIPPKFYATLHQNLPSVLCDDKLTLKEEIGKGEFVALQVQDGLWAQQINVNMRQNIVLHRKPLKENQLFVIDFYLSQSNLIRTSENQIYNLGFENINMMLTSSTTSAQLSVPSNKDISIFNIVFTRDWLLKNVLIDHPESYNFFNTNEAIYFSENLDYKLKELLKKINLVQDNKLTSVVYIIQIIDYLFEKVKSRTLLTESNAHIHSSDLQQLIQVREFLDEQSQEEISLDSLSKKAGMSLSKFKRLFKQVFGTTPYQYYLANKMEKAMELLKMQIYSVSEIGFLIGYSNLSQFSKAFKNHFGILPSEVH